MLRLLFRRYMLVYADMLFLLPLLLLLPITPPKMLVTFAYCRHLLRYALPFAHFDYCRCRCHGRYMLLVASMRRADNFTLRFTPQHVDIAIDIRAH